MEILGETIIISDIRESAIVQVAKGQNDGINQTKSDWHRRRRV